MKSIFKANHRRTLGPRSRDFDRILHSLCAAVEEERFFGCAAGRQRVQFLGQLHIALIRSHHEAGVQVPIHLGVQRRRHLGCAMANVQAANATCQVEKAIAVYILNHCAFRVADKHRRDLRHSARYGACTPR